MRIYHRINNLIIRLAVKRSPFMLPYALPALNTLRIERSHCTHRNWEHGNKSGWIGYNAYAVESILIDLFSTSEHRRGELDWV